MTKITQLTGLRARRRCHCARAEEHARRVRLFADERAADWFARLPYDEEQDRWYSPVIQTSAPIDRTCSIR